MRNLINSNVAIIKSSNVKRITCTTISRINNPLIFLLMFTPYRKSVDHIYDHYSHIEHHCRISHSISKLFINLRKQICGTSPHTKVFQSRNFCFGKSDRKGLMNRCQLHESKTIHEIVKYQLLYNIESYKPQINFSYSVHGSTYLLCTYLLIYLLH